MRKLMDRIVAALGLLALSPILLLIMFLVWRQDSHSPFYIAERTGLQGEPFRMIKLRSMVIDADRSGVDSTANDDTRITAIGHFIRRYKLDEIMQLVNVIRGEMSLVGPRPNVRRETDLYTREEKRLLSVRPGITDLASIVYSDEGSILAGKSDPDIAYNQLVRPGKSKLGLFYVDNASLLLDIRIVFLTVLAIVSRPRALTGVADILRGRNASESLVTLALREEPLTPMLPPGAKSIVTNREGRVDESA